MVTNKKGSRWVIPKGHLEPEDDCPAERAETEAWEEAGVLGLASRESVGSYLYRKKGKLYRVRVFTLQDCRLKDDWPEVSERHRILVAPSEAATMVKEDGLREILCKFSS